MANLPAGGMTSFGEVLNQEGIDSSRIQEAFTLLQDRKLAPMDSTVSVVSVPYDLPDNARIADLNIREATVTNGKHLLDLVQDVDSHLSIGDLISKMKANDYKGLSAPFCEHEPFDHAYFMNVNIHKQPDGKLCVLKWFVFNDCYRFFHVFLPKGCETLS